MKTCNKCAETKPFSDFHKKANSKDGYQSYCKSCNNKTVRDWQDKNPDRFETNWKKHSYGDAALLKRKASRYGLSVEQLKQMIDNSNGICEICGRLPINWLVVDHCHSSLKVRGLICERCNQALGLFNDDIEFMENAIRYLQK